MSYVLTFIGFALLIILHEAGHFTAAKAVGMRVERFSLFFGRTPLRFTRGETEYGIGWIPAGGFVKITGMSPVERLPEEEQLEAATASLDDTRERLSDVTDGSALRELERIEGEQLAAVREARERLEQVEPRKYINQPPWKRIVVILAGPAVNVLIAFVILLVVFMSSKIYVQDSQGNPVASNAVAPGQLLQPAKSILRAGDRIVAVDGRHGLSDTQIAKVIGSHRCAGTPVAGCKAARPATLTIQRGGKLLTFHARPVYDKQLKRMLIGFGFAQKYERYSLIPASGHSVSEMWTVTSETVSRIAQLFKAKDRRQVHGIIGVSNVIQQEFSYDSTEAFTELALISLSLAIVNLFPFLPLDGGHVFWAVAEKVRRRRISYTVMERAGIFGFALILILFVIGLTNDISHPITIPH